jgi:Allene oxide cyclase barrel like domain
MIIRRLGVAASAAAVVGLAAGSVGPALGSAGGADARDHHRTIRVLEISTETQFVDTGDHGPSLGDEFVFASKLMKDGKQVGHDGGVCTVTSLDNQEVQCQATVWLDAGQITVQGLVPDQASTFTLPVTGGSGAYKGAEGELHVHEFSDTRSTLTFHLSD